VKGYTKFTWVTVSLGLKISGCDFGIDGKEHFYVLNAHKRCVDIFMADGKMIRSMPITVSSRSKDLLVDEEGRFACLGSFNIYVFDAEGKPITVVNRVGIQAKHFSYEDGLLYGDGTNEIISDSKNVASSFVFPAKLDGKKFPEFGKWIVMGDKPLFTDRDGNTINYYSNEDYRWPKNDDFKQVRAVKCNREYKVLASIPYLQYKMNRHTQDLYFSKIAEDNLLHIMM